MFQKKDYVVTSAQGVCIVADVPKLVVGKEQQMQYYLLQSIANKKKRCYIPVEHHETVVRAIMTKEEALQLQNFMREKKQEILEKEPDLELAKEWLESAVPENWCRATLWLSQFAIRFSDEVKEYLIKANHNLLQELTHIFQSEEHTGEIFSLLDRIRFKIDKPRLYVDFNELVDSDIVLLSKEDTAIDSEGNLITFYEGMPVSIYSDDADDSGEPDNLIGEGIAIKFDFSKYPDWQLVKWCCQFDEHSIMNASEMR